MNINWILLGVIQKVRSLRRGGGMWGSHWKVNKNEQLGVLACVYVRFKKKMLRFSKWNVIAILQFFLLIIMAVWNIRQTIIKDYNIFSPVNEWHAITFTSPHKITIMWVVFIDQHNIYLQPLVIGWILKLWCRLYRDSTVGS